jgi:hypothetical protein
MKHRAFALTILLLAVISVSEAAEVPHDLRDAMQARLEAVWSKDAATWSRLTADEFTIVIPEGHSQTKAERLNALKSEKPESPHPIRREVVHVYGNTAVRRFVDGSEWVLEVWVRGNETWRVVAAQVNFARE